MAKSAKPLEWEKIIKTEGSMGYNRQKFIMPGEVTQIIKTDNGDGTGNVIVVATDDSGKQTTASENYNNHFSYNSEENVTTRTTQEALDKL
jgi:hypothetical protein